MPTFERNTSFDIAVGSQGNWLNWSNWSKCDVECGSGKQRRTRDCSSQGACTGNSQEVKHCNKTLCNVQWSECSKTCGNGTRSRRACATCVGEFEDCYLTPCHQRESEMLCFEVLDYLP